MDSILRTEKILTLIQANPGISGQELAEACNVPWAVLQDDLNAMLQATDNPIPLYTDTDEGTDEAEDFSPEVRWYLDSTIKRNSPLHLTIEEALQIIEGLDYIEQKQSTSLKLKEKLTAVLDLSQEGSFRYIKGSTAPIERMNEENFRVIENAINGLKKISFTFNSKKVKGDPLGLIYYSRLRQWYLAVSVEGIIKTYSFARIQGLQEEKEAFEYSPDFSLRDWLAPRWGMEFGEPLKVKVRFVNRAQTIAKVRKDVAHRQCQLTEEDDGKSLIYEDTVIGRNEFIAWILGFGSAAELLEPEELRQELAAKVKETLARYQ